MDQIRLKMLNISKGFPGVQALDNVDLTVKKGSVHALIGENGAGKSTLMKILLGIYHPDEGSIVFNGENVKINHPRYALNLGISMIHQELNPVLDMRVCDNIFLGREPQKKYTRMVDDKKLIEETRILLSELRIENLSPISYMKDLSISQMQMIEIAKAVSHKSELIIMDEPTSAITDTEIQLLFRIIEDLKQRNISVIYISHKLDEIFNITDEITVLRDGKMIGCDKTYNMSRDRLHTMMIDRELNNFYSKSVHNIGEELLEVKDLSLNGKFQDISFTLRRGEILGIYGLMGSGRTEIVETIFGLRKKDKGSVYINGRELKPNSVYDAIKNGLSLATEDRRGSGLFLDLSVKHNISIVNLSSVCSKFDFINSRQENRVALEMVDQLDIRTPSTNQSVKFLSGGNQQKVVLAKWLYSDPDILVLDEPTRGIDVGAKHEIYQIMDQLTQRGKSIILISSEMPEIVGMAHRVLVVRGGHLVAEFSSGDITPKNIIKYAAY
jgi:inositol transport system ATP-binding protein